MSKRLILDFENPDSRTLSIAVATLQRGGLLVYPTDTVYGIGVDPLNAEALERLRAAKHRLEQKPILLIAHSIDAASTAVDRFTAAALTLANAFWPGPLTLILPARSSLPVQVTQNSGTVGVRIPSSPTCLLLAELFGGPVTSTSANVAGEPTPGTVDEIETMLGESIDLYLDAGPLANRKPSTIVDMTIDPPRILRDGAVSRELLTAVNPDIR